MRKGYRRKGERTAQACLSPAGSVQLGPMEKGKRGFTLVEVLVVVAIVAVLAAMALPMFSRYRQGAYRGAVRSDVRNAVSAVMHFRSLYGQWPTTLQPNPCGPGPTTCSLTDGVHNENNIIGVSRGVTLDIQFVPCPGGGASFVVRGTHRELGGYFAEYNGCNGTYQGF